MIKVLTFSEPIRDTAVPLAQLPTSIPLRTGSLPKHLREALSYTNIDETWNHPALMHKITTFTNFDSSNYPHDMRSLFIDRVLRTGSDNEGNSYIFEEKNGKNVLLSRPINITLGDCRHEKPDVLTDIVRRFGGYTEPAAGSGMNTFKALALMGFKCDYRGVVGNDQNGRELVKAAKSLGIPKKGITSHISLPTAHCVSMITPDNARTMLTHLGAANSLSIDDINESAYAGATHLHCEGYRIWNLPALTRSLELAQKHGLSTSLDLGSLTCVQANGKAFLDLIAKGLVTLLFGNFEEMQALKGPHTAEAICEDLGKNCTVFLTLGADGCAVGSKDGVARFPAEQVEKIVDTTGAGDAFSAGVIATYLKKGSLERRARIGALFAAHTINGMGAHIHDPDQLRLDLKKLKKQYS